MSLAMTGNAARPPDGGNPIDIQSGGAYAKWEAGFDDA